MSKTLPPDEEWPIEKGIMIPLVDTTRTGRSVGLSNAMRKMGIGDSVFVSHERGGHLTAMTSISYVQHGSDLRFTRRTVEGGVRIWRRPNARK